MTPQRKYKERMFRKGYVIKQIWVHKDDVDKVMTQIEKLREVRKFEELKNKIDNGI